MEKQLIRTPTYDFLGLYWRGGVRHWSDTGLVLRSDVELVDLFRLEAFHFVPRLADVGLRRPLPLEASFNAVFHHIVEDLRSTVVFRRLPTQRAGRLCHFRDLRYVWLARFVCKVVHSFEECN